MNVTLSVGFIGVGAITEAVVRGLRSKHHQPSIHLSPRSEAVSQMLAAEVPNVYRETSNAEVVSKSQIVVLAVRPEQLREALNGLSFRADQTVISFVATVPVIEIAKLVSPASNVCRVTPLTFIEKGRGPIVMAPRLPVVEAMFDGLGDVLVADTEEQMMAFGCAAALLSTFYEFEHTVAQWLVSTGVTSSNASLYVRSMFSGIADAALACQGQELMTLANNIETPGGLNERVRKTLRDSGLFSSVTNALSVTASLALAPPKR